MELRIEFVIVLIAVAALIGALSVQAFPEKKVEDSTLGKPNQDFSNRNAIIALRREFEEYKTGTSKISMIQVIDVLVLIEKQQSQILGILRGTKELTPPTPGIGDVVVFDPSKEGAEGTVVSFDQFRGTNPPWDWNSGGSSCRPVL